MQPRRSKQRTGNAAEESKMKVLRSAAIIMFLACAGLCAGSIISTSPVAIADPR